MEEYPTGYGCVSSPEVYLFQDALMEHCESSADSRVRGSSRLDIRARLVKREAALWSTCVYGVLLTEG